MESHKIIAVYEHLLAENPSYRKSIGAFYTPEFIVNYMVDVCFSKCFHNKSYEDICQVTVLDPACGGGAFLVGAYQYLLDYHSHQRVKTLSLDERKEILFTQIFGVDIDAEAIKVCKQALLMMCLQTNYYEELDIDLLNCNIKCGNSLISRFPLDSDLKQALKKSKWTIDSYRLAVSTYRNSKNRDEKREMEQLIADIKSDFRSEISKNDPKILKKRKLEGELFNLMNQTAVFGESEKEKKEKEKKEKEKKATIFAQEIQKLDNEIEAIKNSSVFDNAFEWRFEFPEVMNDDGDFVGFDVVVGNPPYIQLQSMKEVSEHLKEFEYQTYEKTGDIYSLFYEKGNNLLKKEGYLAFITSNKWMRAGYGKTTRNYFLEYTQPQLLIDLGSGVFDEATVDANILIFKKESYQNPFDSLDISREKLVKGLHKPDVRMLPMNPEKNESWIIASKEKQNIKKKIECIGKPLKEWDIQIYRGILTGFNEAFIIDGKQKDELIKQDPKNAKIIKPILRGRDIKRYKAEFADLWLINAHNGVKSKNIPRIDVVKDYPMIYKYLQQFEEQLIQRQDKGEHWTNLRNCAYIQNFEKEKIIFQEMVQASSFILDADQNNFCLDTARIITGKNLKFLISILNSKLFFFAVKNFYGGGGLGETGVRMKHSFFENFVLKQLSAAEQKPFIKLVEKILAKKEKGADTSDLEAQIDQLVYKLYDLTEEEIKIIEKS